VVTCPYCGATIANAFDLADHFAGDNCPGLVRALGPVTAAGKRLERETNERSRFQYQTTERDRLANAHRARRAQHVKQVNAYRRRVRTP
jgi:hypothetical protein